MLTLSASLPAHTAVPACPSDNQRCQVDQEHRPASLWGVGETGEDDGLGLGFHHGGGTPLSLLCTTCFSFPQLRMSDAGGLCFKTLPFLRLACPLAPVTLASPILRTRRLLLTVFPPSLSLVSLPLFFSLSSTVHLHLPFPPSPSFLPPPLPPSLSPSAREHQPPSVWPCHLLGHPLHRPQDVGEAHAHGDAAGCARSEEGPRGAGTRGHRRTGEGRGGGGGRRETIHWPEKQRFHAET